MSTNPRDRAALNRVTKELAALPANPENFDEIASQIIAIFEGKADIWTRFDEQYWSVPNFHLVRSVRNLPQYGPQLFAALQRKTSRRA